MGAARCVEAPPCKKARVEDDDAAPDGDGCLWEGSYADLLTKHLGCCGWYKVLCPQGCGELVRRKDLEVHAQNCASSFIQCAICGVDLRPGDLAAHRAEKMELHVQLLEQKLSEKDAAAAQQGSVEAALGDMRTRL